MIPVRRAYMGDHDSVAVAAKSFFQQASQLAVPVVHIPYNMIILQAVHIPYNMIISSKHDHDYTLSSSQRAH